MRTDYTNVASIAWFKLLHFLTIIFKLMFKSFYLQLDFVSVLLNVYRLAYSTYRAYSVLMSVHLKLSPEDLSAKI